MSNKDIALNDLAAIYAGEQAFEVDIASILAASGGHRGE